MPRLTTSAVNWIVGTSLVGFTSGIVAGVIIFFGLASYGGSFGRPAVSAFLGAIVGAFIGFAGLMIVTVHNARLARDRDEELHQQALKCAQEQRKHDRCVLAAALAAELFAVRAFCANWAETIYKLSNNRELRQKYDVRQQFSDKPPIVVFSGNANNLGLLGVDWATSVAAAYYDVIASRNEMRTLPIAEMEQESRDETDTTFRAYAKEFKRCMTRVHNLHECLKCIEKGEDPAQVKFEVYKPVPKELQQQWAPLLPEI
jgi:hypothetical protein